MPAVKGYMPLCVTPRSKVCDEQGVGQWPMWKRFESVKGIVDQYIDKPYRSFLAMPYHEIDKMKAEELFYWYTPRCDTAYVRLSQTGDDHDYYKGILADTLKHYRSVVAKLQSEGKAEDANFLSLSLKYAGDSEDSVYCGDDHVVATVWGMRQRPGHEISASMLSVELMPEVEYHTVRFELGDLGTAKESVLLNKSHGSKIRPHQVPEVKAKDGYVFKSWDRDPLGVEVKDDLLFTAMYKEQPKPQDLPVQESSDNPKDEKPKAEKQAEEKHSDGPMPKKHHVRFLSPENLIVRELDVEHGKRILPGLVPQLPSVGKMVCPAWDGNPLNDVIVADHDYKALKPKMPEKPQHTVRFLLPDGQVCSQLKVEHGSRLSAAQVPPLPVLNGVLSPAWDVNPVGELINADRDFMAKPPQQEDLGNDGEQVWHRVRFIGLDGKEVMRTQVLHGNCLKSEQVPPLPVANGKQSHFWVPNPLKLIINKDTDIKLQSRRHGIMPKIFGGGSGMGNGFWRWMLRIALFILFVFVVLYIIYLCNPCSK